MGDKLQADDPAFEVLRSLSSWKSPSGSELQRSQLS